MSYVLHLPSKNKELYGYLLEDNHTKLFHKPDNLDIVVPITLDQVDSSLLIKQIHNSGYDYYNCIDKEVIWERADKLIYIYNSLKLCKNEYAIVLDGNDTVILKDLDSIIDDFKKYNTKIVYNSEIYNYRGQMKYCYNGGVCIGKVADLLEFYELAISFLDKTPRKYPSEHPYLLKAINKWHNTRCDGQRALFICYNYEFRKQKSNEKELSL